MKYKNIVKGQFIDRPNRFVANVLVDGKKHIAHVKNTGRCKELLVPGCTLYLEDFIHDMRTRKLRYDLISVEKVLNNGETLLINMDSQVPNKVVKEGLLSGRIMLPFMDKLEEVRPETVFGNSRFDFYIKDINGKEGFLEVKGVTLENDGICSFPDAVTERGRKHMIELIEAKRKGYMAYSLFLVQMSGMKEFRPADDKDEEFGKALRLASKNGVNVLCYECKITKDSIDIDKEVKIRL